YQRGFYWLGFHYGSSCIIINCHFCCLTTPPTGMGRYIRTSFRPCMRTLWVGLAKSGQRRAEGPPLGWIKVGPNFLRRSRPPQDYIRCDAQSCTKPLEHQAFGYVNNEDQRLV